jgi:hypothetical protein
MGLPLYHCGCTYGGAPTRIALKPEDEIAKPGAEDNIGENLRGISPFVFWMIFSPYYSNPTGPWIRAEIQ